MTWGRLHAWYTLLLGYIEQPVPGIEPSIFRIYIQKSTASFISLAYFIIKPYDKTLTLFKICNKTVYNPRLLSTLWLYKGNFITKTIFSKIIQLKIKKWYTIIQLSWGLSLSYVSQDYSQNSMNKVLNIITISSL